MWTWPKIEHEARLLLAEIEKHAADIWPNTQPTRLDMCDPEAACELLNLKYLPDQHLGIYGTATAGMLDRRRKAILLSYNQSFESLRFTAAHELGHWMLHPNQLMFRDRSLSDHDGEGRPWIEREADYFAACFLAPPRLVVAAFRARFAVAKEPLTNTNTNCFNLSARNHQHLESLPPGSRQFARAVALADSFNGQHFTPLSKLFCVSPTAMAIRLQELGLVH